MAIKYKNNAFGTLAGSIIAGATSIVLTGGHGARFPTLGSQDYFYATLVDVSGNLEVVMVTARAGDVLTVIRAQDGTTALPFSVGDRVEMRPNVAALLAGLQEAATAVVLSGTDTYAGTLVPGPTAINTNQLFFVKVQNANTSTAPTISLNGGTALTVQRVGGTALAPGDLAAGLVAILYFNGANYILLNPLGSVNYLVTSGTNTYTATLDPVTPQYVTNRLYAVKFVNAATITTPTLNLSGLGAKTIKRPDGSALLLNDIPALHYGLLVFNGTDMLLVNPATLRDTVSVRSFGAKGDGSTNDTAAMQAAHNTGSVVYYPAGVYNFTAITLADGGIIGDSRNKTILNCTDTGAGNMITVNGNGNFPTFVDFQLAGSASKTVGAGLMVSPATGETHHISIERVCFNQLPDCINFQKAAFQSVTDCFFQTFNKGIILDNQNNGDGGDQYIAGNVFSTDTGIWPNSICIQYKKGGGARIIGNKMLSGQFGISMEADGNTNTADLFIIGNSIENQTFAGIWLTRASGTITWENIVIADNQFAGIPNNIGAMDTDTFLSNVSITGNVIRLGVNAIGIDLSRITGLNITGNTITGSNSGDIGIRLDANCAQGNIGSNTFNNVATTLSNSATSVLHNKNSQGGTSTGTTNIVYGSLFNSPSVTITFPTPFSITPGLGDVSANVIDGSAGGISVMCTGVSKTQATFICIGLNNGGLVNFCWMVWGVK